MRQVNCYIPIKVCISGSLSAAQLDELGDALIRAIAARMEQARRTLSEHGHAPTRETAASTHEWFDPTRLSNGRYGLPSYDEGGKAVTVPVTGDIEAQLEIELANLTKSWDDYSNDVGVPFDERAYARRVFILLNFGSDSASKTKSDLKKFIHRCEMLAHSEEDTLDEAERSAKRDDLLFDEGAAFPIVWAREVQSRFDTSADLDKLALAAESAKGEMLGRATYLSDDIWEQGLPISLDQASSLSWNDLVRLGLNSELANRTSTEAIIFFIQALLRFECATAHYWLVHGYKVQFIQRVESIRKGDLIVDKDLYETYQGQSKLFQFKLNAFKYATSSNDINKSVLALLLWDPQKFNRMKFDFEKGHPEGVQAFWGAIDNVDRRIAGTGRVASIYRAGVWADARGYYTDVGVSIWKAIMADWPTIIGKLVALFVLGAVAQVIGVGLVLDLVLLIEFGIDGVVAAVGLAGALNDAAGAKTVVEMEHASARLAQTLIGAVQDLVMWVAGRTTQKIIEGVAKWRSVEKFVKTHGDTPEVRKALGDARGDVVKAERNLAAERKRIAAKQQQKAPTSTRPPEPTPPPPEPPVKPGVEEPAGKPPEPGAATQKGTTGKSPRKLDDIRRDLQAKGMAPEDISSFRGAKRISAALAERVARLAEHFSPSEVKQLGKYFSENKIELTDELMDALIQKVPRGKMGEYVRHLEIDQVHGTVTKSRGWPGEESTLKKTTTVHPGKPPRVGQIVETPGSIALRANLIRRLREEPPPDYHAHHIIPEKQFSPGLDWMRKRFGKNINDADNGVFLAARGGLGRVAGPTANPELTRLHNSYIHAGPSKEYAYTLTRRLGDLHGEQFLDEVREIGKEMSNGSFKIDEIPRGWKRKWEPGMTAPIEPGFEPGRIEE